MSGWGSFSIDATGESCFNKIFVCFFTTGKNGQGKLLLYLIYRSVGIVLYLLSFPFVLFAGRFQGDFPDGLSRRYGIGFQVPATKREGSAGIWIHAASVGEVQAAGILINELLSRGGKYDFFLSTMTKQGLGVALSLMPAEVFCFLAPLDVPVLTKRFLDAIEPDIYVCLETELWPAMFFEAHKAGIPSVVLNGRMTQRSFKRYQAVRWMMARLFGNLSAMAVISREDGDRFKQLGMRSDAIRVTGNMKYDYPPEDTGKIRETHRALLQAGDSIVFICGSTRTGEEEILFPVYQALKKNSDKEIIWILAPRHLERLKDVQGMIIRCGLEYELYSHLKTSGRTQSIVLVDTMGELGQLYSAGDFNFVGGSLVNQRGHNIMEAARWSRPVYYGPSIDDFKDAAEILENGGGSFRVADGDELAAILIAHLRDKKVYEQACAHAGHAVSLQQGAAGKQADMVLNLLPAPVPNI